MSKMHDQPCPFCGTADKQFVVLVSSADDPRFCRMVCKVCGMEGPTSTTGQERAVELWNTRSGVCADCGEPDTCPIWLIAQTRGADGHFFSCGFWKPSQLKT